MIKKGVLWFLFCTTARSAEICLMLSPTEKVALTQAQEQAHRQSEAHNPGTLRLNGIIYSAPNAWTIWINGRPINPGECVDGIRILKVTPDSVEIFWMPKPKQQHQFCLKPNQVFHSPVR